MAADKDSFAGRWTSYRATKTQAFWLCAGSVVATLIVGFTWGGFVTGSSAREAAAKAATAARADLAASVCMHKFASGPDATAKLASLKGTDSWKRTDFIEQGGWVALPGMEKSVAGAAELCARQLIEAEKSPTKAGSTAG